MDKRIWVICRLGVAPFLSFCFQKGKERKRKLTYSTVRLSVNLCYQLQLKQNNYLNSFNFNGSVFFSCFLFFFSYIKSSAICWFYLSFLNESFTAYVYLFVLFIFSTIYQILLHSILLRREKLACSLWSKLN